MFYRPVVATGLIIVSLLSFGAAAHAHGLGVAPDALPVVKVSSINYGALNSGGRQSGSSRAGNSYSRGCSASSHCGQ